VDSHACRCHIWSAVELRACSAGVDPAPACGQMMAPVVCTPSSPPATSQGNRQASLRQCAGRKGQQHVPVLQASVGAPPSLVPILSSSFSPAFRRGLAGPRLRPLRVKVKFANHIRYPGLLDFRRGAGATSQGSRWALSMFAPGRGLRFRQSTQGISPPSMAQVEADVTPFVLFDAIQRHRAATHNSQRHRLIGADCGPIAMNFTLERGSGGSLVLLASPQPLPHPSQVRPARARLRLPGLSAPPG
jgi:hypothetical protein